jgi:hypothetical protein
MAKKWQKMAKNVIVMRVGLEPTQLSLLAPEASALTAWRVLDRGGVDRQSVTYSAISPG